MKFETRNRGIRYIQNAFIVEHIEFVKTINIRIGNARISQTDRNICFETFLCVKIITDFHALQFYLPIKLAIFNNFYRVW